MKKKWPIAAVILCGLVAAVPYYNADRWGPSVRQGLEAALGRKVEIGAVRINLFTGLGFSVRKVVIHERPEVSAEPFAYVDDLVVRLRLLSLLAGKLEISAIRLNKPHVNLMRRSDGGWNVQQLLAPPSGTSGSGTPGESTALPELEVRRGRLNFKIDGRKSEYYFTGADIDLAAVSDGTFDLFFVGEMARTDRVARGFGRLTAQGRLRNGDSGPRLSLDLQLEPSALQELSQLAGVRDIGVHGVVTSRATLSGPLHELEIAGQLELKELHHWTQPPRSAGVEVSYTGSFRPTEQALKLTTDPKRVLRMEVEASRLLDQARWRVDATAEGLSLEPLAEWLRPPGADFDGMTLAGSVAGTFHAADDAKSAGTAAVTGLVWEWGEANQLSSEQMELRWADGSLKLPNGVLQLDGAPLQMECGWRLGTPAFECKGASKGHDVTRLQRWMKALGLRATWVEDLTAGQLRGTLAVAQDESSPLSWRGQLELRNAELRLPEFAQPARIAAAGIVWQQDRLVVPALQFQLGGIAAKGSYRYEAGTARPHRMRVETETVEAAALEALIAPLWRGTSFLRRALGMGEETPPPAGAELELSAGRAGALEAVRATLWREKDRITIPAFRALWRGGTVQATGGVRLGGDADIKGSLTGARWEGGSVNADWRMTGRGGVRLAGTILWDGPAMDSGKADFRWESAGRLSLGGVEGTWAGHRIPGDVSGEESGPLLVDLGGDERLRIVPKPLSVAVERE